MATWSPMCRVGRRDGFLKGSRLFASWEDIEHLLLRISPPRGRVKEITRSLTLTSAQ